MVACIAFLTSLISQPASAPNSTKKSDLRRAIARDNSVDFKIINGVTAERLFQTVNVLLRASFLPSKPQVLCKIWLIYMA
jgi:hypothetical protein